MNGYLRASSEAVIKIVSIQTETAPMLARRFTIVCLVTMLFAMAFARIVAQSSENPAEWRGNLPTGCVSYTNGCRPAAGAFARL